MSYGMLFKNSNNALLIDSNSTTYALWTKHFMSWDSDMVASGPYYGGFAVYRSLIAMPVENVTPMIFLAVSEYPSSITRLVKKTALLWEVEVLVSNSHSANVSGDYSIPHTHTVWMMIFLPISAIMSTAYRRPGNYGVKIFKDNGVDTSFDSSYSTLRLAAISNKTPPSNPFSKAIWPHMSFWLSTSATPDNQISYGRNEGSLQSAYAVSYSPGGEHSRSMCPDLYTEITEAVIHSSKTPYVFMGAVAQLEREIVYPGETTSGGNCGGGRSTTYHSRRYWGFYRPGISKVADGINWKLRLGWGPYVYDTQYSSRTDTYSDVSQSSNSNGSWLGGKLPLSNELINLSAQTILVITEQDHTNDL